MTPDHVNDSPVENEPLKLYQDLVETSQDLIWQCDINGCYIYLNPAWETIFGYKLEEMLGKKFTSFQDPGTSFKDLDIFNSLLKGKTIKGYEAVHIGKSGNKIHLVFNAKPARNSKGEIKGTQGTAYDISDRKRAEEQLRISEEINRSLVAYSPMGIHQYELQNNDRLVFIGGNPSADSILGVDNATFIGKTIEEAFPALSATEIPNQYRNVIKSGKTWQTEQIDYYDYAIRGAFHVVAFKTGTNRMAAMFLDITQKKQGEEALRKSEQQLKAIFNSTFQFTWLLTSKGTLIKANKAALDFANIAENDVKDKPFWETPWWSGNEDRIKRLINAIQQSVNGAFVRYEIELSGANSKAAYFDFSLKPVYDSDGKVILLLSEGRDISEVKQMEEELQRTQKLESLGLLAGGIAHDFNNLMGGLFGYIDLAQNCSTDLVVSDYLEKALATLNRARSLTQQLLTFAKGGAPIQKVGHLFPTIKDAALFALSGSNVICKFDIQDNLWLCNFDKNQISQVVENIIINAQQAMPMGGTIEMTARNISYNESNTRHFLSDNYIRISIKDNGIGMPKAFLSRIFDPFFTTKALGHGLGLATCYSIVKRHGGTIEVESEQGKGTTLHIYLPAVKENVSASDKPSKTKPEKHGTIFIMDDEKVVRDTMGKMLEILGYDVKCTMNGKEMLDLLAETPIGHSSIAGLILDLTIPGGMGGKEIIQKIRSLYSDIPVFVSSGYSADPVVQHPSDYGFTDSICKPFTKNELSELLSKYLKKPETTLND